MSDVTDMLKRHAALRAKATPAPWKFIPAQEDVNPDGTTYFECPADLRGPDGKSSSLHAWLPPTVSPPISSVG